MTPLIYDRAGRVLRTTVELLSGPEAPKWMRALEDLYEHGPMDRAGHEIFWTLEVGREKFPYHKLKQSGVIFSDGAEEVVWRSNAIRVAPLVKKVRLTKRKVSELVPNSLDRCMGDWTKAHWNNILIGAESFGLLKSLSEIPALLRDEYCNQPQDEKLLVPIAGSDDFCFVLSRHRTGELMLGCDESAQKRQYDENDVFVFQLPA